MKSTYIWMDGELIPFEDATVHFLSPTVQYGFGTFDGIRCYETPDGPAVFRLKDHLKRFVDSNHIVGITDFQYTVDELRKAVHETIEANGFSSCYIRPAVYVDGPLALNSDQYSSHTGIAAWEWGTYLGEDALEQGVRMTISSLTRLHPNVHMTKAKAAGNYINSIMASTLAHRNGYDDAIMMDPEGYVAEGSGMNIFVVRDNIIYTPYRASVLEGITRDSVITISREIGYTLVEEPIVRDQLYIADEIFVTGTAAEVTSVTEIDTRVIGSGRMGPVTRSVQKEFFNTVHGEGFHSHEWLDYVKTSVMADIQVG
jgi:branched-chain amino acid aminotransferase